MLRPIPCQSASLQMSSMSEVLEIKLPVHEELGIAQACHLSAFGIFWVLHCARDLSMKVLC